MESINERYKQMSTTCRNYQEEITNLKNQVYGYNNYLDIVLPLRIPFPFCEDSKEQQTWNTFLDTIYEYYISFTDEHDSCFSFTKEHKDKQYIFDMLTCIFYYLKNYCDKEDYTFLGLTKLLKTFIDIKSDVRENSILWILYSDTQEERESSLPLDIGEALERIYENFNCSYASRIADCIWSCVRFFLYDKKLDYISDPIMYAITNELIDEIQNRLFIIAKNRKPRKGRGRYEDT